MYKITADYFAVSDNQLTLGLIVRVPESAVTRFAMVQIDTHSTLFHDLLASMTEVHDRNLRRAEIAAQEPETPLDLPWS